jgi:hypothetical protein
MAPNILSIPTWIGVKMQRTSGNTSPITACSSRVSSTLEWRNRITMAFKPNPSRQQRPRNKSIQSIAWSPSARRSYTVPMASSMGFARGNPMLASAIASMCTISGNENENRHGGPMVARKSAGSSTPRLQSVANTNERESVSHAG